MLFRTARPCCVVFGVSSRRIRMVAAEIDSLDPDDRHFIARKSDLDDRLYKMYDKIEEMENGLMDARAKKQAIEADKITGDNIYKILICFDKLYATMTEAERQPNG